MASTPEKKVKEAVVKILKARGAYYFYPVMGGYGRSGIPDIVVCYRGRFIGIECKAGKNQATALQEAELLKIEKAQGLAMIVSELNVVEVENLLNTIDNVNDMKDYR
jgi:Holliday junction resolvase